MISRPDVAAAAPASHAPRPPFEATLPMHGAMNPGPADQGTTPGSFANRPDIGGPLSFSSPDTPGMPAPSSRTAWDFLPEGWTIEDHPEGCRGHNQGEDRTIRAVPADPNFEPVDLHDARARHPVLVLKDAMHAPPAGVGRRVDLVEAEPLQNVLGLRRVELDVNHAAGGPEQQADVYRLTRVEPL